MVFEEKTVLVPVKTASIDDRPVLRTRQSKCEDSSIPKDRERQRPGVAQTRPTLGAVGRVASRVRTSGISRISTFLPRSKGDDDEINASPWGVGTAAVTRSQSVSVLPDATRMGSITESVRSPEMQRKSDVLDMSSPMSTEDADQHKVTRIADDRNRPTAPLKLLDRQASNALAKSKFSFRPSASIDARSPTVANDKVLEIATCQIRKATREDRNSEVQGIREDNISVSAPVVGFREVEDEKMSASKVTLVPDSSELLELADRDPTEDTEKSRISKFAFGKAKGRGDDSRRNGKARAERSRGRIVFSPSISQAGNRASTAGASPEQSFLGDELQDRQTVEPGAKSAEKLHKRNSAAAKGKRTGWLAFLAGEQGGDRNAKQGLGSQDKRKEQTKRRPVGPDFFARAAARQEQSILRAPRIDLLPGRSSGPGDAATSSLEDMRVMDAEEFDVEKGEAADEIPIRSLALDDFITYQTRKAQKARDKKGKDLRR